MKVKILKSNNKTTWYNDKINQVIDVFYDIILSKRCFTGRSGSHCLFNDDVVITELPESFCVNNCEDTDKDKWVKYIWWLNKTYDARCDGYMLDYYGINHKNKPVILNTPHGVELHIDDIIKHIDFYTEPMVVESEEEFDMSTNEGRLAYAIKYYPIGTKYVPLDYKTGDTYPQSSVSRFEPQITINPYANCYSDIDSGNGFIYVDKFNKWAEIIDEVKEEKKMETQKLSRKGLKEIHSVACSNWKGKLEGMGIRNPLEDYIELTQEEVDEMFKACTKDQLPIVSKYLKQDDGSVDLETLCLRDNEFLTIRNCFEYTNKAFWLNDKFNWEIKKDSDDELCLIPTKKK